MSLVEQKLLTHTELYHWFLVGLVVLDLQQCNVLEIAVCPFSFGHCVICPFSIYGSALPLWYLQALLIVCKHVLRHEYRRNIAHLRLNNIKSIKHIWRQHDRNKSTAHGCWTLDFFVSGIKLQAIYKVIHTSNYDGLSKYVCKIGNYNQRGIIFSCNTILVHMK